MATPWESKAGFLTLGAVKCTEISNSPRMAVEKAAISAELTGTTMKESLDATTTKQEVSAPEAATTLCCIETSTSGASGGCLPFLTTSSAFFERITSKFSSYATACRGASNIGDWMSINNKYFGSSVLYTDEISTGLLFGYCAGYAFNRALRFGALLCGIGFISLQTLNHFGYIQVNWKRLEEDIKRPLDVNGDGKVDQEDVAVLQKRLLKFMAQGVPSTAGLSLGLLWGLRSGR